MEILSHEEAYANCGAQYRENHAVIEYPEGFRERLLGKSVEEQMNLFAVVENSEVSRASYGETDSERVYKRAKSLTDLYEFRGLVVENGLIEGILVQTPWSVAPMGPYDTLTTYYADDNNGSGSKSRKDTVTLICLPPEKEQA